METVSVRYIVDDVEQAVRFYRTHLGFAVDLQPAPGFALLSRGRLRLLLNAPGAGGAGRAGGAGSALSSGGAGRAGGAGPGPRPGGWNRFQLPVSNLEEAVARVTASGVDVRSPIVSGQGGRQALVADPSGNLVELFEPWPG